MKYVVDASVAVKWYVPEINATEAELILDAGHDLFAPEQIYIEFGNIVWKKVRLKEITEDEGKKIIAEFQKVGIITYPHKQLLNAAYIGAILSGLTVYDWTYMALAVTLYCEFVTADEKLFKSLEKTKLKKYLVWVGNIA